MKNQIIHILLIDNNPSDIGHIKKLLKNEEKFVYEIKISNNVQDCVSASAKNSHDIILLDLSLPDSTGIDSLKKIQDVKKNVPIVILTDNIDKNLAVKCVQLGAQDYLVKNRMNSDLLIRAIRYAIERNHLLYSLNKNNNSPDNEQYSFRVKNTFSSITAKLYDSVLLKNSAQKQFLELVGKYKQILLLSLDEKILKVDHNISEKLEILSENLGNLKANPRDIVDMHKETLNQLKHNQPLKKYLACLEESKIRLIEIMGYLVSFYRKYAIHFNIHSVS